MTARLFPYNKPLVKPLEGANVYLFCVVDHGTRWI